MMKSYFHTLPLTHHDTPLAFFVIVESRYLHNGKERELVFDINKYEKFKNKIILGTITLKDRGY